MDLPHLEPNRHNFSPYEFGTRAQFVDDLGNGSDPIAVMLTCWELGCRCDNALGADSGEIMVVQNPAGLVPHENGGHEGASMDSIIYGASLATVKHLIVCGHTQCKTLWALLFEETQLMGNPFRRLTECIWNRIDANYSDRTKRDWLDIAVQESVLRQLANIKSYSAVQPLLRRRKLLLHGWIRDDQTSTIAAFDPLSGQFCE